MYVVSTRLDIFAFFFFYDFCAHTCRAARSFVDVAKMPDKGLLLRIPSVSQASMLICSPPWPTIKHALCVTVTVVDGEGVTLWGSGGWEETEREKEGGRRGKGGGGEGCSRQDLWLCECSERMRLPVPAPPPCPSAAAALLLLLQ